MLSFNTTLVTVLFDSRLKVAAIKVFQYNSCYCSINSDGEITYFTCSFNTTLVTVLLMFLHYVLV